ncbi:hypothetical protein DCCM_2394 [Desulfocucumis palustris]|uniref:UspA domain-containing protein n=1 Tax=Desulfocucumis palustris TaxID=1898651 RepID=A0A2L2XAS3_9FIRM|nr:universal stress protein [Desulfocucumis palustris]GBF33295.1 hypothetical protein DCCM_2394 [Desulfocucumis palustris]
MQGQILFVTDGSASSRDAGAVAIELAGQWNAPLRAIAVIDESWENMLGDEWINSSGVRNNFFQWLGKDLQLNARSVLDEFCSRAKTRGLLVQSDIIKGRPDKIIIKSVIDCETALLVLPNPYATKPAAESGLKYNLNAIARKVNCPIWVAMAGRPRQF